MSGIFLSRVPDLPRGQREIEEFPRFGLTRFAQRFPTDAEDTGIAIGGDVEHPFRVTSEIKQLERVNQISNFHCVTTWSKLKLNWSGFRFADFYRNVVLAKARPDTETMVVVFRAQDGYRVSMLLEDLLAPDVMLADRLDGQALDIAHGAPLRLVAPAHYGYKNAKHISAIEFWRDYKNYRPPGFAFMDHPRARVEHEERGRLIPGRLLRWLYRPLIRPTMRNFRIALADHLKKT